MDFICEECNFCFFLEEGYETETDLVKCPHCGHIVETY